jgi:aminomethyltransferase
MTVLRDVHAEHDAQFEQRGGREVVRHYGRPERSHRAVRKVVGVIEQCYDVLGITGEDRIEFVDNAISNDVPHQDGQGTYALLLTPQGRIRTDMYAYNADERLLVFLPPGEGQPLAEDWREKTFIQDVDIATGSDDFGVFGVHGPKATEKIASVFSEQTPETPLSFSRGSMGDAGVTVIRTDAPTGEEGYEVICASEDAVDVFDTLENRGLNATPFGTRTWESLTLEAGTPLFESELGGALPNNLGIRNAIDFEKGCFVGQEVVSRVENRGQPNERLVGLVLDLVPDAGAAVFDGDESVGEVTRAMESPMRETPIALAVLDSETVSALETAEVTGEADDTDEQLTVRVEGEEHGATLAQLPFVEGSQQSNRLPRY